MGDVVVMWYSVVWSGVEVKRVERDGIRMAGRERAEWDGVGWSGNAKPVKWGRAWEEAARECGLRR